MSAGPIVVVGAGHAGLAVCAALVEAGQGHRVQLVGDEHELAYQRPPLSKSFLKNPGEQVQHLREAPWFADAGMEPILGDPVRAIDRQARVLHLASGRVLPWAQLVLATGTRARTLPAWPPADNVHVLRSAQDARALREGLARCAAVTVLGGGFIGLEVAATCIALGKPVTVLEAGSRLMGRAVSAPLSAHVLAHHRASGMQVQLQAGGIEPVVHAGRMQALRTEAGTQPVDLLVLAIGAVPNDEIARDAGLTCDNGIVVDAQMRTSDPQVWAVGDCASFPWRTGQMRLESIQNAQDQARVAAASLLGGAPGYQPVPWFWSEQGTLRLQMVGMLADGSVETVRREGAQPGSFSLFHYQQGRLHCVEAVNAPADYMMARKLLEAGISAPATAVADTTQPLRALLSTPPA